MAPRRRSRRRARLHLLADVALSMEPHASAACLADAQMVAGAEALLAVRNTYVGHLRAPTPLPSPPPLCDTPYAVNALGPLCAPKARVTAVPVSLYSQLLLDWRDARV